MSTIVEELRGSRGEGAKIVLRRFIKMAMEKPDGLEILEQTALELEDFAGFDRDDNNGFVGDYYPEISDKEPDRWAAHCQAQHIKGYVEGQKKVNDDLGFVWCDDCRGFYLPHEH